MKTVQKMKDDSTMNHFSAFVEDIGDQSVRKRKLATAETRSDDKLILSLGGFT